MSEDAIDRVKRAIGSVLFDKYGVILSPDTDLVARAAIQALAEPPDGNIELELWQDDMVVASVDGPRDRAHAEISHYAAQYGQDGPFSVAQVIRIDAALSHQGNESK